MSGKFIFLLIIVGSLLILLPSFFPLYEKYNIILITVDSLRADYLSCYGYPQNITPNICSLAEEGVLFENAFSQGLVTSDSLPSLFTSEYPSLVGIPNFSRQISFSKSF
jgi:predicted AlkP superfamily pyrophosphatase or phosphodiesterase